MAKGNRKAGDFCWINLLTPDPKQAQAFFGKLLGWTYVELPGGMGHAAQVGGRSVGGIFDLADPMTPKGTPPGISVVVKVDSAEAASKKVASLGGKAKPPFDVMDQGRMVACSDPNGAAFDLWEPKKGPGTDADSDLHGAPSWFETLTTDVDRATKFYTGLFGWKPEVMPMPGSSYTTFKHGKDYIAGMMKITPEMGKMPPHWGTYFTVDDADKTATQAVKLGAKLCMPPKDIPDVGRFCGISSPQGVMFYVIKYAG